MKGPSFNNGRNLLPVVVVEVEVVVVSVVLFSASPFTPPSAAAAASALLLIPSDRESGAVAPSVSLALISWRNFIDCKDLILDSGGRR